MDNLVSAAGGVCVVSVLICVLRMIAGGTKLKGQAELIMKLVLAASVTAVISDGALNLELPDIPSGTGNDYSAAEQVRDAELIRQTGENISEVLRGQLSAAGIDTEKIETEVNILEDGSIIISRVITSSADNDAAAELIRSSLGQETEVVNGDS